MVARGFVRDAAGVPWLKGHAIHWAGSVEFDPQDPRAVWVTSGNGVFRTADVDAVPTTWTFTVDGLEETVPLGLVSRAGYPLVSAIGDYDGFVHDDPARHGRIHEPQIGTTTGLAAAGGRPLSMARLGDSLQLTTDGGTSWHQSATLKGKRGQVALSADGATILHTPQGAAVTWRSVDCGAVWTAVNGLAGTGLRPLADPVDARVFYALDGDRLLASADGGASFSMRASLPANGAAPRARGLLQAAPGRAGDLWAPLNGGGLAHSLDGGTRFARLADVSYCGAVGFGKAAPGAAYPAVYIWGTVGEGARGIYRSLDGGTRWARINDDAHQYGGPGDGKFIVGDMNRYGVVYMSTAGRGIVVGRPLEAR